MILSEMPQHFSVFSENLHFFRYYYALLTLHEFLRDLADETLSHVFFQFRSTVTAEDIFLSTF